MIGRCWPEVGISPRIRWWMAHRDCVGSGCRRGDAVGRGRRHHVRIGLIRYTCVCGNVTHSPCCGDGACARHQHCMEAPGRWVVRAMGFDANPMGNRRIASTSRFRYVPHSHVDHSRARRMPAALGRLGMRSARRSRWPTTVPYRLRRWKAGKSARAHGDWWKTWVAAATIGRVDSP